MNSKVVIITGANSGIGRAATIKFAEAGSTVIMACRNIEKSKKVQKEIIERTKNSHIDLIELDISSFKSIKCFCKTFKNKYKKLDILIHNAAYFNYGEKNYQLSSDGIELTFATNIIGPFLMTQMLIDELKKSDDARILTACTTNIRHFFEAKRKIDFDNLQGEFKDSRPYNVYKMYGDSKMALLMLTFKMADTLKKDNIKVNSIQIPATKTSKETRKKLKIIWRMIAKMQNMFSLLPEEMADIYLDICTSEEFKDITGKLINDKREIVQSSLYSNSIIDDIKQFFDKSVYPKYADKIENIDKVWELCVKLTESNSS
ncbi:SDR family NAD(P)-dependent oxidoreductase [Mycoplasmatota bacterium]|nr:SDR family NAD(P)-dependent oxidoreductase [Mycoplasmatota bacterium]